jgi:thiamine kinase-like enzyme
MGGITNRNYRVEIGGETFVLRVGGEKTALLGIDRQQEFVCATIAAQLGIGPEIVHFHPEKQAMVSRFLIGETLSATRVSQPEMLARIVQALRRVHDGPDFPGRFSPFETVRQYHALAVEYGVAFPANLPDVFARMERIEAALLAPDRLCPCHNDLLCSNLLEADGSLRILDWEYAGMGDPFFDLGNFSANHEFDAAQCEQLLRLYCDEAREADVARLHLMRLVSDLREAFWGYLQSSLSSLDCDYLDYAQHHLNRFLHQAAMPECEDWLQEATHR